MILRSSSSVVQLVTPAARTTFSSSITEPTSFPPKRSPIWQTFNPCVTQLDCTLRKFERYRREIASTFKYSTAVASSQCRPPSAVLLRLKAPRDERRESARLFLQFVEPLEMIDAVLDLLPHAEHHGRGGPHADLVRGTMHVDPVFRQALQPRNLVADFVVENFRAAAGNGIESRIAQAQNRVANTESRCTRRSR